jgi:hypothetical protein
MLLAATPAARKGRSSSSAKCNVRELGLAVRAPGVVASFEVWVLGVDRATVVTTRAGDRDDAGVVASEQGRHEQRGEREVAEMVDGELHLEPVLGPPLGDAHHARVVDEHVDVGTGAQAPPGGLAHRCQRREVERLQLERGAGDLAQDRAASLLGLALVARRHHDERALTGELPGDLEPEPAVRPGDDGDPARLIPGCPRRTRPCSMLGRASLSVRASQRPHRTKRRMTVSLRSVSM